MIPGHAKVAAFQRAQHVYDTQDSAATTIEGLEIHHHTRNINLADLLNQTEAWTLTLTTDHDSNHAWALTLTTDHDTNHGT